jgi:hypothetical protein
MRAVAVLYSKLRLAVHLLDKMRLSTQGTARKPTQPLLHQPAPTETLAKSIFPAARREVYLDRQSPGREGKESQGNGELIGVVLRVIHQLSAATHSC